MRVYRVLQVTVSLLILAGLTVAMAPHTASAQSLDGVWEGRGRCKQGSTKARFKADNPVQMEIRTFGLTVSPDYRASTVRISAGSGSQLFPESVYRGQLSPTAKIGGWLTSCDNSPDLATNEELGGSIAQVFAKGPDKLKLRSFQIDTAGLTPPFLRRLMWECKLKFTKTSETAPSLSDSCP